MSDLPNREKFEKDLERRFAKLAPEKLAELKRQLGDPPNVARVDKEFWDSLEKDAEIALAVVLMATFLSTSRHEGLDLDDPLQAYASNWVGRYSRDFAKQFRENTLSHVHDLTTKRAGTPPDEFDPAKWEKSLDLVFGPHRWRAIGVTEVTSGHTAAMELVRYRNPGSMLIWNAEPGACEKCKMCDGTEEIFWRRYFPKGPPSPHLRCRCFLELQRA